MAFHCHSGDCCASHLSRVECFQSIQGTAQFQTKRLIIYYCERLHLHSWHQIQSLLLVFTFLPRFALANSGSSIRFQIFTELVSEGATLPMYTMWVWVRFRLVTWLWYSATTCLENYLKIPLKWLMYEQVRFLRVCLQKFMGKVLFYVGFFVTMWPYSSILTPLWCYRHVVFAGRSSRSHRQRDYPSEDSSIALLRVFIT